MLSLPLPILTFIIAAIACVQVWRVTFDTPYARVFFTLAFALIAAGTLLVGLRFGYGLEQFVALQRSLPMFFGPAIYLGFAAFHYPPEDLKRRAGLHLGLALALVLATQAFFPILTLIDVMIALSYLVYAVLIFVLWRKGQDALSLAPLGTVHGIRTWMCLAVAILLTMLVFDLAIAVNFATGKSETAVRLISGGSGLFMVLLIVTIFALSRRAPPKRTDPHQPEANAEQTALEARARSLLKETQLYLDTDLTLDRLARRLSVPARALSEAINQTQGQNVSQYVNTLRLEHASNLLATTGLSVRAVMEQSGFLTRSNFYREFERVYACSPTEYRQQQKTTDQA